MDYLDTDPEIGLKLTKAGFELLAECLHDGPDLDLVPPAPPHAAADAEPTSPDARPAPPPA